MKTQATVAIGPAPGIAVTMRVVRTMLVFYLVFLSVAVRARTGRTLEYCGGLGRADDRLPVDGRLDMLGAHPEDVMPADAVAFISYARDDDEPFAARLRDRPITEQPAITLWRDRDRVEGGADWWLQIREANRSSQHGVMTALPNETSLGLIR